jgi:hypothetical protein
MKLTRKNEGFDGEKLLEMNILQKYKLIRNLYRDKNYREWHFKYSTNLVRFKNLHQGEKCFIIGNGPSLNKTDLSKLEGIKKFGLNKIYLLFDRVNLDLSYHVTVNPFVISQSQEEISHLNCESFVSYLPSKGFFSNADNVNFIFTEGGVRLFQEDITGITSEGATVTYVALQIAYYMGFKEVFLIGVDHNFVCSGKPNEAQYMEGNDQNHFDESYFQGMNWHLPDLASSEMAYCLARYHYTRDGRKIYDATVDGKLDVFPKIQFEKAVALCRENF